ncbi:type II secretion system F family protein [Arthrobacter mobilis]|uniref:Type II secretion system F family protein n=1 Tax=Arthrobacter mobilis TaxID=2724944 RepID=A0A7X6QMK5_9MICC|nr:type II secretion system F family protein [Arthrobacter mobilis]NKX56718.1 type II secretion system F family protein [Arthrobacter mobilis]
MPPFIILAAAGVAASVPLLAWILLAGPGRSRRQIRDNLLHGLAAGSETAKPPSDLERYARRLTLPANAARLDRWHALAGRPKAWPLPRLLVLKPVLAGAALLLGLLLLAGRPSGPLLVLVLVVSAVAYFVPDLLLYSRGQERQAAIGLELPDTLDQMMIAVEAGLGFDSAMARAGENGKGPLAEELVRALQDMRVGLSRKEAYRALGERTSVPDLRTFIRSVIQADAYGISISAVLRTQAQEMRLKRRQRAEEKAMQIPVKVLFPLMLFILPVLLIAVLGPTVLSVVKSFS